MNETKDNTISLDIEIEFPTQYMKEYLRGELDYDTCVDKTKEECYRLIEEYMANKVFKI